MVEITTIIKKLISAEIIEIFLFLLILGVFIVLTLCFLFFLTFSIFFDFGFIFRFLLTSEFFFTGEVDSAGRGNNTRFWKFVFYLSLNDIGEPRRLIFNLGFLSPIRFFFIFVVFLRDGMISRRTIINYIKYKNIGREFT